MIHLPDWLSTVFHAATPPYVSEPYPRLDQTVTLRLRVTRTAPVQRVYLRTFPDGEQALTPMALTQTTDLVNWYSVSMPVREPSVHYRFLLVAEDGVWQYTAAGPLAHVPLDNQDFRLLADYKAPEWVKTAVFYQIFPDRFANGDPTNDPQPDDFEFRGYGPRTYPWGEPPDPDQPFPIRFYGGDLPGIIQHLDYLERLGVNALYLNPVFTAHSNHKYDVVDYENVDPHFGGNDALIDLRQALTARGMRYLLDIVPNHCGYWHHWFQAAQADPAAPEADYFTFTNHPDEYLSWLGVWSLPKLNYQSAALRQRIYEADDAIFRRWLQPPFSADGWRVDVANMLGRQGSVQLGVEITHGIRQAVKETRPDAYLMAENFFDGSPALQGDQWDGNMNYSGFTNPLWYWLAGYRQGAHGLEEMIESAVSWPTAAMAETWRHYLAAIPWAVAVQQFNLLDSHDVPRIRTIVGENDALHRLAAVVQFTFPGVPCIYYGDEIGLVDDPHVRQRNCMPWDETVWDQDLLAFYQRLIRLRRETAVLHDGAFQILSLGEHQIVYQRQSSTGRLIVVACREATAGPIDLSAAGIPDGSVLRNWWTGVETAVVDQTLPIETHPQGASIWMSG